jgi:AraC-like DNA-binding protein
MFSVRRAEFFARIVSPVSFVVAVLEGQKGVLHEGGHHVLGKGDLLIVPKGVAYDATASPDRQSGRYRAIVLQLHPDAGASLARREPELCKSPSLGAFDPTRLHIVSQDAAALQALLHFTRTLLLTGVDVAILNHRLEGLLLALSLQHARDQRARAAGAADVRAIARGDLVLATRLLIRSAPEAGWPANVVSRRLAVSGATLRRRLASAGFSLRTIRTDERMALAAALLTAPNARVVDVALRCGYQSPSKFTVQYRRWFGATPREREAF